MTCHRLQTTGTRKKTPKSSARKAAVAAAAKAKADAEAAKNRKPKAVRIEEKREEKRRQRAAEEDGEDSSDEDEADKRARMRKQEQDADLRHAQDLLSAADIHPRSRGAGTSKGIVVEDSAGKSIDLASIALFQPKRKTDFDALSEALCPLLRQSSVQPHYALWISGFVKNILQDLPSAEIKKVASQITAQSNEKMKEEKLAEKTGKKSKAAKNKTTLSAGRDMGRGMADTTAYDDGGLDDGDFM